MKKAVPAVLLLLAALWFGRGLVPAPDAAQPTAARRADAPASAALADAQARQRQDVWVEGSARVLKLLPDDTYGNRHQRFLLDIGTGRSVLVAHNIDLAPRIDGLRTGDTVAFRGEYIWNDKGGVLHWTHHAPDGSHPGGWLAHQGRDYR